LLIISGLFDGLKNLAILHCIEWSDFFNEREFEKEGVPFVSRVTLLI
jgi:hypothetical protein